MKLLGSEIHGYIIEKVGKNQLLSEMIATTGWKIRYAHSRSNGFDSNSVEQG